MVSYGIQHLSDGNYRIPKLHMKCLVYHKGSHQHAEHPAVGFSHLVVNTKSHLRNNTTGQGILHPRLTLWKNGDSCPPRCGLQAGHMKHQILGEDWRGSTVTKTTVFTRKPGVGGLRSCINTDPIPIFYPNVLCVFPLPPFLFSLQVFNPARCSLPFLLFFSLWLQPYYADPSNVVPLVIFPGQEWLFPPSRPKWSLLTPHLLIFFSVSGCKIILVHLLELIRECHFTISPTVNRVAYRSMV